MNNLTLPAVAVALMLGTGVALAQAAGSNSGNWISIGELTSKLEAQGYSVREIERDDGRYEVDIVDRQGVRYEAKVNRSTGEIISRKRDD